MRNVDPILNKLLSSYSLTRFVHNTIDVIDFRRRGFLCSHSSRTGFENKTENIEVRSKFRRSVAQVDQVN